MHYDEAPFLRSLGDGGSCCSLIHNNQFCGIHTWQRIRVFTFPYMCFKQLGHVKSISPHD